MLSWQFRLLGVPQLRWREETLALTRSRGLALLAYLAVTGETHSREALATLLWPESTHKTALRNLRRELSLLRKTLAAAGASEILHSDRHNLGLRPEADLGLDVSEVKRALAVVREHGHFPDKSCAECLQTLTAAVANYRGEFMAGFNLPDAPAFDEWQFYVREGLRQDLAAALEMLVKWHEGQGNYRESIEFSRQWLHLDPLYEPAQRRLIQNYALAGRRIEAERQYEVSRRLLEDELGVEPEEATVALVEAVRRRQIGPAGEAPAAPKLPAGSATPGTRRISLPEQATPFVGRSREKADVSRLLSGQPAHRLVTIAGPGGSGKTRLALAAAENVHDHYPDGVYFVAMAPLDSWEQIITAIARQVGLTFGGSRNPEQQLQDYLRDQRLLVVLDNFEHLIRAAPFVANLLQAAPEISVLVTSRERLRLSGEAVYTLAGMNYPQVQPGPTREAADLASYDAIRLLVQQARLVRPDFTLDAEAVTHASRISRLVQGMPLALVLAAAWLDMLSLAEIANEITRGLDLLKGQLQDMPARQRSMRATFRHSWNLLSANQQKVFSQLSIFRGGFTLPAAQTVTGADLTMLRSLVGKSLLSVMAGRYQVHELLRQFAFEQLEERGDLAPTSGRHSSYYLQAFAGYENDFFGRRSAQAVQAIEADLDNIKAAWSWALERDDPLAVDVAIEGLFLYVRERQHLQDGVILFEQARRKLEEMPGGDAELVWGRITNRFVILQAMFRARREELEPYLSRAMVIARDTGNRKEEAYCHMGHGILLADLGQDAPGSLDPFAEALAIFEQLGEHINVEWSLHRLGLSHFHAGNLEDAAHHLRRSLSLAHSRGHKAIESWLLAALSVCDYFAGTYQDGLGLARESLKVGREVSARTHAYTSAIVALGELLSGQFEPAKRLASKSVELSRDASFALAKRVSLSVLAIHAAFTGDSMEGRRQAEEAVMLSTNAGSKVLARWAQGASATSAADFTTAKKAVARMFDILSETKYPAAMTWALAVASLILAKEDLRDEALSVLALVWNHPLSPQRLLEHWPALAELRTSLEEELGDARFTAAWSRGNRWSLEETVQQVSAAL